MQSFVFKYLKNKIKKQTAFTIIELVIVITIIGILALISFFSYDNILANVRNSQRSSNTKILAESLEKYYDKNGEYPGCTVMTNSDTSIVANTLGNISAKILTSPLADQGYNSIVCGDIDLSSNDMIAYNADESVKCQTGNACSVFELKYQEEITGDIKIIKSRHSYKSFATKFGSDGIEYNNSIIQSSDDGFVSVGSGFGGALITKTSSTGVLIWSKLLGGSGYNTVALDVMQSSDGGYIVAGYTADFGAGEDDVFIAKYTSSGALSWSKVWGGIYDDRAYSAIQTSDGNYFIAGSTNGHAPEGYGYYSDGFVAKIDSNGSVLWSKTVYDASVVTDALQISDGSYVTVSYSEYDGYSYIIKLSSLGALTWSRTLNIPNTDSNRASSIVLAPDGSYVVAGNVFGESVTDPNSAFLAKISNDGNMTWLRTYSNIDTPLVSLTKTFSGGYAISGRAQIKYYDVFVARVDSEGLLLWSKSFGKSGPDSAYDIIQSNDSGFVVAGSYYNYTDDSYEGYEDSLTVKFKPDGSMNNCASPICQDYALTVVSPSVNFNTVTATINPLSLSSSSPAFLSIETDYVMRIVVSL